MLKMDKKHVEAALFVSKTPLTIEEIAKMIDESEAVVLRWIVELKDEYKDKGMIIKQVAGGFEMVSNPECIEIVQQIVPKQYESLSRSAEETLAIIAYNQPVRRAFIAKLRGVLNPDHGLSSLLDRHLIRESEDGFITTDEFLHFLAINDLKELPKIEIEQSLESITDDEEALIEETITHVEEHLETAEKEDVLEMLDDTLKGNPEEKAN